MTNPVAMTVTTAAVVEVAPMTVGVLCPLRLLNLPSVPQPVSIPEQQAGTLVRRGKVCSPLSDYG
jgi:hypothetical protein